MQAFSPFRVIGNICGDVPAAFTLMYEQPVVMVPVGRTFQVFRGKELTLLRGGPQFEKNIRAVATTGKLRFVAEGAQLHAFSHHKPLWSAFHSEATRSKSRLLLARDEFLFSVGEDRKVAVFLVKSGERVHEFLVEGNATLTNIAIPSGYANKLIATTAEGTVHLYNFHSGKCLYVSPPLSTNSSAGGGGGGVRLTALAVSPYKDLIAVGSASGRIVVFNFALGTELMSFNHESSAVTSLCFRADKDGLLMSGTVEGEIAIWNLHKRALEGIITRTKQVQSRADVLDTVHSAAVHGIFALPNTSMVVSAGADNALVQFRFDTVDGLGLLTRERRGHVGSCSYASFYNTDLIVTAGNDQALRVTHVFSDRATWELSQGKLGKRGRAKQLSQEALKLPPATKIECCTVRNYQWSSIVSIHESCAQLVGWRMDTRAQEMKTSGVATSIHTARSVGLSMCGGFAVVGYSSGHLTSINLQNQKVLHFFAESRTSTPAHAGSVEVVEICGGNTVVASSGLDGLLKLWNLFSGKLLKVVGLGGVTLSRSVMHRDSSLLIAACDDNVIRAFSADPLSSVADGSLREFAGHTSPIAALALAPDTNRHVVSASTDCVLLLWDIAAACCVGQYRTVSPVTSIGFHPDAQFLLTTHAGERGAFLWTNNLRYGFAPESVTPQAGSSKSITTLHYPLTSTAEASDEVDDALALPTSITGVVSVASGTGTAAQRNLARARGEIVDGGDEGGSGGGDDSQEDVELFDANADVGRFRREQQAAQQQRLDQSECEGLTLSGLPKSSWVSLTMLDHLKTKNQPLLPPKKRDVPFFLMQTKELRPTFIVQQTTTATSTTAGAESSASSSSRLRLPFQSILETLPPFHRGILALEFGDVVEQHEGAPTPTTAPPRTAEELLGSLEALPPSAVDAEIRQLIDFNPDLEYAGAELEMMEKTLVALLRFLTALLNSRRHVDFVQALVHNVIKVHGHVVARFPRAAAELAALSAAQQQQNELLRHMWEYPGCLVSTFTNAYS